MSFVLIVEPEEVNAARIRAILDGVDKKFSYELVTSAEKAIDVVEAEKPDVFIGDMQMPVMSGEELFSMVEMMSPETVRIVMTDAGRIKETIAFMNACRTYKIIIKPCRVADDLLGPIDAAFAYRAMLFRDEKEARDANARSEALVQKHGQLSREWKKQSMYYPEIESLFARMLALNVSSVELPDDKKKRIERWYQWMAEEYLRNVLTGPGDYEMTARMMTHFAHEPEQGFYFRMKKNTNEVIAPIRMNEIAYLLKLVTGVSKDLLNACRISVLIESTDRFYIIRILFAVERDEAGKVANRMFRVRTPLLRGMLCRATELGVAALGYKGTIIKHNGQDMLNLAVPK